MIAIRAARLDDLKPIMDFDYFDHDPAAEITDRRMLAAEYDGRLAGFLSWAPKGLLGRDYISFLFVDENSRRRGVGRALMRAVEKELPGRRIFVSTERNNAPMLALLDTEGWIAAGSITGANPDGMPEDYFFKDIAA